MAATSKNTTAESADVEEKVVPEQAKSKDATVTAIKGSKEPKFDDEDIELTLVEKAKQLVKNKRVIAGAATVALLSVGVLVARKRNTVDEQENETPEA